MIFNFPPTDTWGWLENSCYTPTSRACNLITVLFLSTLLLLPPCTLFLGSWWGIVDQLKANTNSYSYYSRLLWVTFPASCSLPFPAGSAYGLAIEDQLSGWGIWHRESEAAHSFPLVTQIGSGQWTSRRCCWKPLGIKFLHSLSDTLCQQEYVVQGYMQPFCDPEVR